MKTYPVHERFKAWQGEGVHIGRPAFFIRMFGCPVQCPWCDSAGTWHPDFIPEGIDRMVVEQIVNEVEAARPIDFVVVTGGEPTIHDMIPLTASLYANNVPCHLETSGAFPIRGRFDWITVSPKKWKMPIAETVHQADEFKLIIEQPGDIAFYVQALENFFDPIGEIPVPIWLHPEWSQRENPEVLNFISKTVMEKWRAHDFRAGWQLHKLFKVDQLDKRSRPAVPLGGNTIKGF